MPVKGILWLAVLAVLAVLAGCGEWDEGAGVCACGEARGALEAEGMQADTSDRCVLLLAGIYGRWQGVGASEGLRYEYFEDGHYEALQRGRSGRWHVMEAGAYWVTHEMFHGLYRPILHLHQADQEAYSAVYFMDGGRMVLEEAMGDEQTLVFLRQ